MHLVNMDVEHQANSKLVRLGPFSTGLNALYSPTNSGKTKLLNGLRLLALEEFRPADDTPDPAWISQPFVGRLEFFNRGHHIRVSSDGSGRKESYASVPDARSHERNGQSTHPGQGRVTNGCPDRGELSGQQRAVFWALVDASTAANEETSLERLAARLGISDATRGEQQPAYDLLLARQGELESRLKQLRTLHASPDALSARQSELEAELRQAAGTERDGRSGSDGQVTEQQRFECRLAEIKAELNCTQAEIDQLERELAQLRAELKKAETSRSSCAVDNSYRQQLQQIDDRLQRWRQTLRDLKLHRDRIDHDATDALLHKQLGDQLCFAKDAHPRVALRSLESQILSARARLDSLVDRYSVSPGRDDNHDQYAVHKDEFGVTRIVYHAGHHLPASSSLPETLQSMQQDLYQACQQLARHESRTASETLKQQSQQLLSCETELTKALEKLIEERAMLLQKIAGEYDLSSEQLALAFGDGCGCHQHYHLRDWLLKDEAAKSPDVGVDPATHQRILDNIDTVDARRKSAELRAEEFRRQLKEVELQRRSIVERREYPQLRLLSDIRRDLETVNNELGEWNERERLQSELDDVRRRLAHPQATVNSVGRFRESVHRQIAALMGGREGLAARGEALRRSADYSWTDRRMGRKYLDGTQRPYDLVDGIVCDSALRFEAEVPKGIVCVAMKLAICEWMTAQSEPISLVLSDELDQLDFEIQRSAVAHLARFAQAGQQIVILTRDERIPGLVLAQHGWVSYLPAASPNRVAPDINRHLTALANDYEADKWYTSTERREDQRSVPTRGEYYMTRRSLIEESPSIGELYAARCRACGVDRIADLLDVDPFWLAEQLRQDGVSGTTVASWQAESHLLCSVRQLRPFDARLLVAIGVRTPQQLADMHPSQLLERVERFVATDRGRRLLRSGSSYELSRITTWIASAKGGAKRSQSAKLADPQANSADGAHGSRRVDDDRGHRYAGRYDAATDASSAVFDRGSSGYNRQSSGDVDDRLWAADESEREDRQFDRPEPSRSRERSSHEQRLGKNRSKDRRRQRRPADSRTREKPLRGRADDSQLADQHDRRDSQRSTPVRLHSDSLKLAGADGGQDESMRIRFYLELSSPVVDAPSIGPRMAARLEKLGIQTVDQLLAANPGILADKLNLRRIDDETIRAWQEQARLVCRIPNLRGHDAQLLVACNLTSPEELAEMKPATLLSQVLVIANSGEGQRILRGSKQPDLAEVTDWITWAGSCRTLYAA